MRKTMMHALPLLIAMTSCALALTGCERKVLAVATKPPANLLSCAGEPVPPSLPGRDQQDARDALMLDYALALRSAWGDCASKISGVRRWADALPE